MSGESPQPSANPYDVVPYNDRPYSHSHPRHLEAMAALFGMQSPPITRCRVLELGCAAGANLIPMAVDYPQSAFLGIDFSQRQIDEGQRTVDALGLKNIELRRANILDVDDDWGMFDYIIAHGIFSWVPEEVQDKILSIAGRNLASNGVAYISYNTYPGWHLVNVVRDLLLFHAGPFEAPQKQILQAKAVLEFMAELSDPGTVSGKLLREECELLKKTNDDAYLFHEHLERDNHPVHFYQFMRRAEAAGLQYLAEAEFSTMLLRNLPEKARQTFAGLPSIQQEQYMDYVRGRRFRKTLLCHQHVALERKVGPERIPQFHVALPAGVEAIDVDIRNEKPARFQRKGNTLTVTNRLLKAAMIHLKEVLPRFVAFADLHATALARVGRVSGPSLSGDPSVSAETLASLLLVAYSIDLVQLALHPPCCTTQVSSCPRVSPLARLQAEKGRPVTNQFHGVVPLNPVGEAIVRVLDGRHDRAELVRRVHQTLADGKAIVRVNDKVVDKFDPSVLGEIVDKTLSTISRAGLLLE